MKTLSLLLLISLIAGPAWSVQEKGADREKVSWAQHNAIYTAQQLMNKKEYGKAINGLQKFIEKNPKKNYYLADFTLANALTMAGKKREAIPRYLAAIKVKPDYSPAWMNLGKTYYDQGRYEKAGSALVKAYETGEDKDPKILYYAGNAFLAAGKTERAEEILNGILIRHPDFKDHMVEFTLANAMATGGRKREALIHYREALKIKPDYSPAWLNLGNLHYDLKEYEKAGEAFLKGYETSEKKDPDTLFAAAGAYVMADCKMKAAPHLERLVSGQFGKPKKEWCQSLLMVYVDLKFTGKAERMLKRLLNTYGDDPVSWKLAYQFYVNQNQYEKAVTPLTVYSYLVPLKREEKVCLGDLLATIGIPLQAARYYEEALESGGRPAEHENLVSFYLAGHKPEEARNTLDRAIEREPTARLWSLMGHLHYREKEYGKASREFGKSARLDPKDGHTLLMISYCAWHMGKIERARDVLRKVRRFPRQRKAAGEALKQLAMIRKQNH